MSAQYGTIAPRRTVELPLWVVGAIALIVLGLIAALTVAQAPNETTSTTGSVAQTTFPGRTVVSTGQTEHVFPSSLETSGVTARVPAAVPLVAGSIYTSSTANIREGGAVFPATFPGALETSGFAVPIAVTPVMDTMANIREGGATFPPGMAFDAQLRGSQPIMIGDYACHQCR